MAPPSAPPTPTSPFPTAVTPQPSSLSRLTLSDKLLLAQAVHHIGSSPPDWGRVSSILLSHPLIRTKSRLEQASKAGITLGRVFGSRECERAWVALMRQYNLVLQPGEREIINESEGEGSGSSTLMNRAKEARGLPPKTDRASQLVLAQFLYAERIREIQESIKLKEQKFKVLVADIESLNSGKLDEKLEAEVQLINSQAVTPTATDSNTRAAPKDRTGATSTTPAPGTPRTTRVSRSGSTTTAPVLGDISLSSSNDSARRDSCAGDASEDGQMLDAGKDKEEKEKAEQVMADDQNADTVMQDQSDATIPTDGKDKDDSLDVNDSPPADTLKEAEQAEAGGEEEEEAEAEEDSRKRTRSSKRQRGSDSGLPTNEGKKRQNSTAKVEESGEEGKSGGEEDIADEADEGDQEQSSKQPEPRRSRRSEKRGDRQEEEPNITPASAVTSSTKNRLGSLRSRETSGASQDGEEEVDNTEADTSRSTAERGASRTSTSPISTRKGRGTSRLSSSVVANRRSRGGSNTSRNDTDLSEAEREKAKRKNEKVLMMLLNEVSNHTHGNLFHAAIKEQDAPDYYALIRHPLDLKTIKAKIKEGTIVNGVQLRRALNQMFANSLIYNRPGTEIHRMALEMRDAAEEMIDRFEQTQLSASYSRR